MSKNRKKILTKRQRWLLGQIAKLKINEKTGEYTVKYDPMNITEDYFIPMRA